MTVVYFDKAFRPLKFFELTVIEYLLLVSIPLSCLLLSVFRREAPIARALVGAKPQIDILEHPLMPLEYSLVLLSERMLSVL